MNTPIPGGTRGAEASHHGDPAPSGCHAVDLDQSHGGKGPTSPNCAKSAHADLKCPACRDEALYDLAVDNAIDSYRDEGIRRSIPSRPHFGACECPHCGVCSGLARDHRDAEHAECIAELARYGADVLPDRYWPDLLVPVHYGGGWRPLARCSACGRIELPYCCPGFGVSVAA